MFKFIIMIYFNEFPTLQQQKFDGKITMKDKQENKRACMSILVVELNLSLKL